MKINNFKRILGVFILLIVVIFSRSVDAEYEVANEDYPITAKFGISLNATNGLNDYNQNFKLAMSNCDPSVNLKVSYVRRISIANNIINYDDIVDVGTLSCNNPSLEINVTKEDLYYAYSSTPGLIVILKSDGPYDGYAYVEGDISAGPVPSSTISSFTNKLGEVSEITIDQTNKINCSTMSFSPTSFEGKFCNAKNKAGGNDPVPSSAHLFKCSDEITDKILDPNNLKGDDYYVNKNYLYHTAEETLSGDEYIYHYNSSQCGDSGQSSAPGPTCTITCEEAVEAEYGPPVASKAGMCFEYKVRVTSRTNCYMSAISEPPSAEYSCCTPVPNCTSSSGESYKQGGPNEDFDKCVKKCDGGKYSSSCSNKCYKEIYGDVIPGAKTNGYGQFYIASKMSNIGANSSISYATSEYFCYEGGELTWHGEGGGTSQYYKNHNWGSGSNYIDSPTNDGIPRGNYGNGNICHDECHWEGCGEGMYLCPADNAESDYEHNMEVYNALIADCNGKSSCSTTTAVVTINVDYYDRSNQKHNIEFPYSRGKDSVSRNEGGTVTLPSDEDSILLPDDPEDGEGILGCYKPGASETNLYRLTWSFPGTWINNKSGEISYTKQGTCDEVAGATCSWRNMKQKFCLPNNTGRVNANWWNAYYKKVMDNKNIDSSLEESEVIDKCVGGSRHQTILEPGSSTSPEEYNIHAKAVNFGYYDWNIQMDCFYATNPTPLVKTTDNDSNTSDECKTAPDNYRIRSIDLENVFPAKDGSETTDPSSYGRLPGHNWTKYSNPSAKDASYNNPNYFKSTSDPISYLSKIQADPEAIYDGKNIEYEFQISPKDIREIRKDFVGNGSSNNSFANFDEKEFYMDNNGVARYYSSDIRRYAKHINNNKNGGLSCNNMQSYSSDACE